MTFRPTLYSAFEQVLLPGYTAPYKRSHYYYTFMIMFQTTMKLKEYDDGVGVALVHEQLGERPYTIVRRVSDDSQTMDVVRLDVTTVCVRACVLLCVTVSYCARIQYVPN